MKVNLSGEPIATGIYDTDEILLGFDRMTDDEIIWTMQGTPYPEFMGGKLKQWLQRRKKRAKAVVQKIKKKFKKMPKWAKIATGILAAPLALPAAAGLTAAAAPLALTTAATALPAVLPVASTAGKFALARKIAMKRAAAKRAAQQKQNVTTVRASRAGLMAQRRRRMARTGRLLQQGYGPVPIAPATATQAVATSQPVQQVSEPVTATEEPKKGGGLGALLALGALGLPFLL